MQQYTDTAINHMSEKSRSVSNSKKIQNRIKARMFYHAIGIIILPIIGLISAAVLMAYEGIGLMEVGLFFLMYVLTFIGMTVGLHRYFTHRSFQAHPVIRILLGILGSMVAQGPIIYWVSNHRHHHQHSDEPEDLHSPYVKNEKTYGKWVGFWHSHVGWTFNHKITSSFRYAKDLLRDPLISKINKYYYFWVVLGFLIPALLGGAIAGTWMGALKGLLWGGFVRLFFTYHFTASVNSVTHFFGSRPYYTGDRSTNNIWFALPTLGGSWHNNHHAFPNSPRFGLEWWEVDPGWWFIWTLQKCGLAWEIRLPTKEMKLAKRRKTDEGK